MKVRAGVLVGVAAWLWAATAPAYERRFAWNEESTVLTPGSLELSSWTTFRFGRTEYFSRFDQRVALEWGVAPNLHATFFSSTAATTEDVRTPPRPELRRVTSFGFEEVSSAWKYRISDPIVNALGAALMLEAAAGTDRAAISGRGVLDDQFGALLVVFNAHGRYALEFERDPGYEPETNTRTLAELDLAAGYFLTPQILVGLELRNTYSFDGSDFDDSVIYAGPTFSVAADRFWLVLGAAPQIVALKGAAEGEVRELSNNEELQVRLLLGAEL